MLWLLKPQVFFISPLRTFSRVIKRLNKRIIFFIYRSNFCRFMHYRHYFIAISRWTFALCFSITDWPQNKTNTPTPEIFHPSIHSKLFVQQFTLCFHVHTCAMLLFEPQPLLCFDDSVQWFCQLSNSEGSVSQTAHCDVLVLFLFCSIWSVHFCSG